MTHHDDHSADHADKHGHDAAHADYTAKGMSTGVAIVGFLLSFLAGAFLMWGIDKRSGGLGEGSSSSSVAAWSDSEAAVPVSSKDGYWGDRSAPVTLALFSDYQCPYCNKVEATIEQVKKTYGKDKVRIVWKNEPLPFHPNAKPAAEAGEGVLQMKGQDAFWKFHAAAFANQSALNPANYEKWAKEAGVTNIAEFKKGLESHKWAAKVEEDHALAQKLGVRGTPATFVNGVMLSGAQPFDAFKKTIDEELAKAQKKIAGGTAKDAVYVAMSKENFKAPKPAAEEEEEKEDTKTVFKVPAGKSPVLGDSSKALVTIIEFSDFQCPYCKKVEPTLKQVRDTYGDKVRIIWKHQPLPFHKRAIPASMVSLEARAAKGDKGFWAAHDKLFDTQSKLEDDDLLAVAKELGLNEGKVKDAIAGKNAAYTAVISEDQALAGDFGVNGTPAFFINGRRLTGAQPFEAFKKIIDEEVTRATTVLASGVKQPKLYDELIKDGKGAQEGPEAKKGDPGAVPAMAPIKGPKNAKVTLQVFSDYQCPYCSRVEESLAQVEKEYGSKVRFVWRDSPLPFHKDAPLAAEAAREVKKQKGDVAYWKFHDKLFADQKNIGRDSLEKHAADLGCDMGAFKAALDSHAHKAEVDADLEASKKAGVNGTPAIFVNNYFIEGAQPYPAFKSAIDKALKEAK